MLNLSPLLDAVDLTALAEQSGAKLRHNGRRHTSACPLHHGDNQTAFSVFTGDDGVARWHCFTGCQTGGDAIDFVQRWQNLEFTDAVKWLADWARVPLDRLNWTPDAIAAHKKHLASVDLFTTAANFYYLQLWPTPSPSEGDCEAWGVGLPPGRGAGGEGLPLSAVEGVGEGVFLALSFILSRGLPVEHLKAIKWGYSDSSDALLKHLLAHHSDFLPLAKETALVRADGCDFTANGNGQQASPAGYIIYPHWQRGKVVYLSARAVNPVNKGDKSRNLPGPRQIYRADTVITPSPSEGEGRGGGLPSPESGEGLGVGISLADALILTEGPADAETCRYWGYPAWAMMGVSIPDDKSSELFSELRRRALRQPIYLAPSNDRSGAAALDKLANLAGPLSRYVVWPRDPGVDKSDANDWLQRGATPEQFKKLLLDADAYLDLEIHRVEMLAYDVKKQAAGLERLADLVGRLAETERKMYIRRIGSNKSLGVSPADFDKMVRERWEGEPKSGIEIKNNQFYHWGEPLGNFVCRITHELSRDDGENPPEILYTVAGKLTSGNDLYPGQVPAPDFDGLGWISGLWGARPIVYIGGGKKHVLLRAIKETSIKEMTREKIYTFTGWHTIDGRRCFLSASGALSPAGLDQSVRVDLPNNLSRYTLPAPPYGGDLVQAIQFSLNFLELGPPTLTVPLWCAMYAAPLTPLKSLNAVIWVYGPTQSKKSVLSHLAKCHYGPFVDGRDYKSVKDWMSSAADLEATMFDCKDVPFIIDDYAPQFTDAVESRKQAKTAKNVVRGVGNRSSRGRRRADMTAQRQYIPRGLVLSTAEQPLVGQSVVGRTIYVEVELGVIDLDKLTAAQANIGLYNQAMAGYLAWLSDNWPRLEASLPDRFAAAQSSVKFPNQDRLADYYSVLFVAGSLAVEWAAQVGAISALRARELTDQIQFALFDMLNNQSARISQQSPVLKFFQAVEDLIAQGEVVLPLRSDETYVMPERATLIGWQDPERDQILLITAAAMGRVKEYWDHLDERFDTLIDALRREIHQHGLLAEREFRQFEKKKWINKKWGATGTQRVLVLKASAIKEQYDIDLLDIDPASRQEEAGDDETQLPTQTEITW